MMRNNLQFCFQANIIQHPANWQNVIIQGTYEKLSGEESRQAERLILNRVIPFQVSKPSIPSSSIDIHQLTSLKHAVLVTYRIKIEEQSGRYEKK